MKRAFLPVGLACLALLAFVVAFHKIVVSKNAKRFQLPRTVQDVLRYTPHVDYGKLPLTFEPNQGQTDPRVKFLARRDGYTVFLSSTETTLELSAPSVPCSTAFPASRPSSRANWAKRASATVRLTLGGSNPRTPIESVDVQPGSSNYLIGSDPSKWHRNIPRYARVKYSAVYPGIDLVYHGNQSDLESDYVLAPHADVTRIDMRIEGASELYLDSRGNLIISTGAGNVFLHKPRAYQQNKGSQQEIAANYIAHGPKTFGIQVAPYDSAQALIIDPVLSYSTYLGGTADQLPTGIAADSAGFAYVTGYTNSADFPTTTGSFKSTRTNNSTFNAFITKMKQDGTGLVYSTFVGGSGSGSDMAAAIAIDASGAAYITGTSTSTDFPITSATAFQTSNKGNNGFLAKIGPTGATLLYSTFLGGTGSDTLNAIALDSNGNAYVTGTTTSADFPLVTATALQTTNNAANGAAFLSRIDPTKSGINSLVYSTYLGGSNQQEAFAVAVDGAFNAYIVGFTTSTDFPQPAARNGFQTVLNNSAGNAFLARIDTTQPALLVYSTYLGGSNSMTPFDFGPANDIALAVAVPPGGGNAYVTGSSNSVGFPMVAALDTVKSPNGITFVARLDTTKSGAASLPFSSYLGGSFFDYSNFANELNNGDAGTGIAVDSDGNIYVSGTTLAVDFPVSPGAPQPALVGSENAFLTELNPAGAAVIFSTYLGGQAGGASAMALDGASPPNGYITGPTYGTFPTTPGAFQTTDRVPAGSVTGTTIPTRNSDGFVAEISPSQVTGVLAAPTALSFSNQAANVPAPSKNVTLLNNSSTTLSNIAVSFTGPSAADFTQGTSTCGTMLAANSSCLIAINFTPSTVSSETASLHVVDSDISSPQIVSLSTTRRPVVLQPAPLVFGNVPVNGALPQTVNLHNYTPVALNGIAISIAGPSAAAFTITGPDPPTLGNPFENCDSTLAPGASCSFDVVFTPTTSGAPTATLSVADSDASSPQTAALTGNVAPIDFSLAVSPAAVTVAAGSTVTTSVTIDTPNFIGEVIGLTCAGAPVGATCSVNPDPASINTNNTGYMPSTVTITTTARSVVAPPRSSFREISFYTLGTILIAFALLQLAIWMVSCTPASRKLSRIFALLWIGSITTGCGGGSGGPLGSTTGTPAGTYTLTITGADNVISPRQTTFSLTVK
jgi:hypothetical protein